ncbi:hypothetical protein [Virgibacillus halotolerans]|uniref:hypothetical protein n=1 Tax=Virgibacillus halotolerans TaxID=1071053 RepID=UPI001960AC75|nr:hypothetical protein [Virgibacillus halotolerans]
MKVKIKGSIYLENDSFQYILKKYSGKTDKKGVPTYEILGYFSSLEASIMKIFRMKISESKAKDLKELRKDIQIANDEIRELLGAEYEKKRP